MSKSKASREKQHKYLMSVERRRTKGVGSAQRKKQPRHGSK